MFFTSSWIPSTWVQNWRSRMTQALKTAKIDKIAANTSELRSQGYCSGSSLTPASSGNPPPAEWCGGCRECFPVNGRPPDASLGTFHSDQVDQFPVLAQVVLTPLRAVPLDTFNISN